MAVVSELTLPEVEAIGVDRRPASRQRFHDLAAEGHWLARTPSAPYLVFEAEAVRDLLLDRRLAPTGSLMLEIQGVTEGIAYEWWNRIILNRSDDDHVRIRRLVSRSFTPRASDRLRPSMRAFVDERAVTLAARGGGDVVPELIDPYPVTVICELIGAPVDDWPRLSRWAAEALKLLERNLGEDREVVEQALCDLSDYVEELLAERRREPRDDLLSELLAVEEEGDRLSHQELIDLVGVLLLGGTDTTRHQLGSALVMLARRPEQWEALRADRSLVPAVVEEVLRLEGAAGGTSRIVTEDVEYRGVRFPAGTVVLFSTDAANRNPSVGRCPMDLDPTADRAGWTQLAFGAGVHYCLGANLARAELQEALDVLAQRWRHIELDGEPVMKAAGIHGPTSVPLRIEPA